MRMCRALPGAIAAIILAANPPLAQEHLWSFQYGDTLTAGYASSMALDAAGNVYLGGYFIGTIDFGGGPLTSNGYVDMALAKFDSDGNHIWSRSFGGTAGDWCRGIAVDHLGNVVMTGSFQRTVRFGGPYHTALGVSPDIVLAKYDANGGYLWSRSFPGEGYDYGYDVAFDSEGNVGFGGAFYQAVDFGGGALASSGSSDIIVAKYDADGNHVWSRSFGGTHIDDAVAVAFDPAGNLLATGYFRYTVDFGGGPRTEAGAWDGYLLELDTGGDYLWDRTFGGTRQDKGMGLATDANGNAFVTGYFGGTADFGGGQLTARFGYDLFLVQFAADGGHVWSRALGGIGTQGRGVDVDAAGNVFVVGTFSDTLVFAADTLRSAALLDIVVAKYTSHGNPAWAMGFGGTNNDYGWAVHAGNPDEVLFAGHFVDTVSFGGDLLTAGLEPAMVLAKYRDGTTTGVRGVPGPTREVLRACPNPFNPTTTITYSLSRPSRVSLTVHDVAGRIVDILVDDELRAARRHQVEYRPRAASGVYFVRLAVNGRVVGAKIVLLK